MKRLIRRFAVWLEFTSKEWVVPEKFWTHIDNEEFDLATTMLEEAEHKWPDDPHIVYAQSLMTFLKS